MLGQENGQAHYMPATPDALPSTQLLIEDAQALNSLSTQGDMTSADQAIKDATPKNGLTTGQIVRRVLTVAAPTGLGLLLAACHENSVSTGPSCPLPTRPSATSTTGETSQTGPTSQTKFESAKSNTSATPTATSTPEATPAPTSTICVGTEGTATPNVEKPRWQTDESYAIFLFLNQNNQNKLTDQERADWQAMKANDLYAETNNQKPIIQQNGSPYQELPVQGMILYDNAHMSADGKQILGDIAFGFHKEVNGTQVPYVVKFRLDSTDPYHNRITNIRGIQNSSDWTNGYGGELPLDTVQKEFDWLQANVGKEVYLGITRLYVAGHSDTETETLLPATKGSHEIMNWLLHNGPKPAGVMGPDATLDQITATPSMDFFCNQAGSF